MMNINSAIILYMKCNGKVQNIYSLLAKSRGSFTSVILNMLDVTIYDNSFIEFLIGLSFLMYTKMNPVTIKF